MGIRINTNTAAINTRRNLYNSTAQFQKSMEKLSSGLRINRAGDDAAGLAISESLKSDIRALHQASRNAADGISLVQTAEGSLDEVSNILLRMKELAEQSLNGTLSDTERGYLDAEYHRAAATRSTGSATAPSSTASSLLDGTGGTVDIQVGIGTTGLRQIAVDLGTTMTRPALGLAAGIDSTGQRRHGHGRDRRGHRDGLRPAATSVRSRTVWRARSATSTTRSRTSRPPTAASATWTWPAETSKMTSYQILQQAGVSVLAQANMTSGLALSLLG